MANYCSNELHIVWRAEIFEGTPYEVVDNKFTVPSDYDFKFEDFLPFEWEDEGEFDFLSEARRRDESEQYGCVGWVFYPNVFTLEVEEIPEEIWGKLVHFIASYDTRWSPSDEFAKRIYEKWVNVDPYVSVTLYYDEPGQVYSGYVHNGKDYPDDDVSNFYSELLDAYVFPTKEVNMPGKMHFLQGNYNIYSAQEAMDLMIEKAFDVNFNWSPFDEMEQCLDMIPVSDEGLYAYLKAMDALFKNERRAAAEIMKLFYDRYKFLNP